jgi:cleavage and polyadenylation specificity factor subunit 1
LKRAAVTVVKTWKGCVAVGLGHRLMMYQWDGIAGRLRGVGMIDLGLQITSLSFLKNFIIAGDILRGVYLLRYKEDPVMDVHMNVISMAASVQQLAKTFPFQDFAAIKVESIRNTGSVGIVSLDVFGNIDLEIFSPVNFGQYLRHSVPFNVPCKTVAILPVHTSPQDKALLLGSASGSLSHLIPVTESEHHLASSLVGLMIALLPQPGGVNARLHRVSIGRETLPNSLQAIESVDCLVDFLYLATPLQAEIANRMKQPIDVLMRTVARWLTPII